MESRTGETRPTGPFPQVGTDAVATLVRLSRRLYLATICTGGDKQCYEPPFAADEEQEFLRVLNQADAETWSYPVNDTVPDPLFSS